MSGLEIIGGLASTAQLAAYAVKAAAFLSDIYERLKHAPERIEQHAHQLKRLIDIILHIKDNHSLHTRLVFTQLDCTIAQACSLRDILIKVLGQYTQPSFRRRYWKRLKGKKEKQILVVLQNLEREKTQLTLCLTAAQIEVLQDFQRKVRKTDSGMSHKSLPEVPPTHGNAIGQGPVCPPSPAPTSPGANQVGSIETQDDEVSDTVMNGVGSSVAADDQKKETGPLKLVIKTIVSKTKGQQENSFGKAAAAGVATDIQVTDMIAEKGGSQTNSF